jgi:hypothetical protein
MVQSNYVPWKGYFDQINMADLFVFYDDVQFTKEDWRNRNRIKTKDGLKWLTVPCGGGIDRRICDVRIENSRWQRKHWEAIRHAYGRAAHFERYRGLFEELYLGRTWERLSELNQVFVETICREILGIDTAFGQSSDYSPPPEAQREERWIAILREIGAKHFVIGPAAGAYLGEEKREEIRKLGVELVWMDYSEYPEYRQLFPPFEHRVSIIDLIFNEGPDARSYMKSFA